VFFTEDVRIASIESDGLTGVGSDDGRVVGFRVTRLDETLEHD